MGNNYKVLVWFGLISFPLYLWHWPLITFSRFIEGEVLSRELRVFIIIASILLAWLTYHFVEKPMRANSHSKTKTMVLILLMAVMAIVGLFAYKFDSLGARQAKFEALNDKVLSDVHFNEDSDRVNQNCKSIIGAENKGVYCQLVSLTPKMLIVGDSHAISFGYSQVMAKNPEIGVRPQDCIDIRPNKIIKPHFAECTMSTDAFKNKQLSYRDMVSQIIQKSQALTEFDPTSTFCDKEKCYGIKGDDIYYFDSNHLSKMGSQLMFNDFTRWLARQPQ